MQMAQRVKALARASLETHVQSLEPMQSQSYPLYYLTSRCALWYPHIIDTQ